MRTRRDHCCANRAGRGCTAGGRKYRARWRFPNRQASGFATGDVGWQRERQTAGRGCHPCFRSAARDCFHIVLRFFRELAVLGEPIMNTPGAGIVRRQQRDRVAKLFDKTPQQPEAEAAIACKGSNGVVEAGNRGCLWHELRDTLCTGAAHHVRPETTLLIQQMNKKGIGRPFVCAASTNESQISRVERDTTGFTTGRGSGAGGFIGQCPRSTASACSSTTSGNLPVLAFVRRSPVFRLHALLLFFLPCQSRAEELVQRKPRYRAGGTGDGHPNKNTQAKTDAALRPRNNAGTRTTRVSAEV